MESTKSEYESKLITKNGQPREYFAIAPMVDVSDKYQRYLMRSFTKHSYLYSEMINEHAVLKCE